MPSAKLKVKRKPKQLSPILFSVDDQPIVDTSQLLAARIAPPPAPPKPPPPTSPKKKVIVSHYTQQPAPAPKRVDSITRPRGVYDATLPLSTIEYSPRYPTTAEDAETFSYLTHDEVAKLKFAYDRYCGIKISDVRKLRTIISDLGVQCALLDDELQTLMLDVFGEKEESADESLTLAQFLELIAQLKHQHTERLLDKDKDLVEAFVAVGGSQDKSGSVEDTILKNRVREFKLNIDIDRLIEEIDEDGSGEVEFEEFATLMGSMKGGGIVDAGTIFSMLGGNPDDPESSIPITAVETALAQGEVCPTKHHIAAWQGILNALKRSYQKINFEQFSERFIMQGDMQQFIRPLEAEEEEEEEAGDEEVEEVPKEIANDAVLSMGNFFTSARNKGAKAKDIDADLASTAAKHRLNALWANYRAKNPDLTDSCTMKESLTHLLPLSEPLLRRGAENSRYASTIWWRCVGKAANALARHFRSCRACFADVESRGSAEEEAQGDAKPSTRKRSKSGAAPREPRQDPNGAPTPAPTTEGQLVVVDETKPKDMTLPELRDRAYAMQLWRPPGAHMPLITQLALAHNGKPKKPHPPVKHVSSSLYTPPSTSRVIAGLCNEDVVALKVLVANHRLAEPIAPKQAWQAKMKPKHPVQPKRSGVAAPRRTPRAPPPQSARRSVHRLLLGERLAQPATARRPAAEPFQMESLPCL